MNILVDTNIILRTTGPGQPSSSSVGATLAKLASQRMQACIVGQNLNEAWAVMTRPTGANGLGMSPGQARAELDLILATFPLLPDPPDTTVRAPGTKFGGVKPLMPGSWQ